MAMIRILSDGGGKWGFGHLRRSATLAQALSRRGHQVRVDVLSEEGRALLPPGPNDQGQETLLVIDLPYTGDAWVRNAQTAVVALDYIGTEQPDLVISIWGRGTAIGAGEHKIGLEFSIIRPEIHDLFGAPSSDGVLILIGGGDQAGLAEGAAMKLVDLGVPHVTVIDGPLAAINRELPSNVCRVKTPHDMAERMASCDWAVTSGGTAMLEMLSLGKAVHVIPRTPEEESLARLVLRQGGLLGIGIETLSVPTRSLQNAVASKAAHLVDGKGVERICELMESLL